VSIFCPACGSHNFVETQNRHEIDRENQIRDTFVYERLDHRPDSVELMDLTEFMHGGPARLLSCRRCGLVLRDEAVSPHYEDDLYDPDLLTHLYPRYLNAFRRKERPYRTLLEPGAQVLEVGSHLGAFLQTAEEWNWQPIGLDVGEDTTRFARKRGLTVRRTSLDDAHFHHRLSAVFFWNCFEQLEDPASALTAAGSLLERHGLLVVRVPNVGFYKQWRRELRHGRSRQALRHLGYNTLLGFPYQYGYTTPSLLRLLARSGFQPIEGHNSTLLTLPVPDPPHWMQRESAAMNRDVQHLRRTGDAAPQTVAGPWIEIVCRRAND
jgi:SAM-dependent methyltransferase